MARLSELLTNTCKLPFKYKVLHMSCFQIRKEREDKLRYILVKKN